MPAASFAKWREQTPDDFVFAVKAPRFATHRKVLAQAGEAVARFVDGGVTALGPTLGPIVWQLPATMRFDAEDMRRFLGLLPRSRGERVLRHAIEARHESFAVAQFVALAREHEVAIVLDDSDEHPLVADVCADFVYARLMRSQSAEPAGYAPVALDAWAARARTWAQGRVPPDLPRLGRAPKRIARDVFVFFIGGAKERAPAGAAALISRL